jgi:LmbE family N-acetylglucosaminyl deacetylase
MTITAVSPHLDDAALSASAALAGRDATVVTVFTAMPAADRPVSWWDRLTGATSSRERQRERLDEDAAAMALLGARGVHLDELEALYRDGDPDLDRATGWLTELLAGTGEVWLPSAIGGHRDHMFARNAGLRAAAASGHDEVVLYADFPYVIAYGWPSWVSGRPDGDYVDAGFWLSDQLAAAGLGQASLTSVVTRLSPDQQALKARVIAAYRSQAAVLRLAPDDLAADPVKLEFELSWRVSMEALGHVAAAGRADR